MAGFENNIEYAQGARLEPSQAADIVQMQKTSSAVSTINHTGSPEGSVAANPSSICHDPVSGLVYVKVSGTGNTGWLPVQTAPAIIPLGNVAIDLTVVAVTPLFTTGASHFLIIGWTSYATLITGSASGAFANFGWTGPDYSDFLTSSNVGSLTATGQTSISIPPGGDTVIVPPSTTFSINITTADTTATANTEKISFLGFYL